MSTVQPGVAGRLRAGLAAAALAAILAGIPTGLILLVGWPLPTSVPTLDQLQTWATSPITDHTVINTLALLLWYLWAQFIRAVAVEALAARTDDAPRRLRGTVGAQRLAAVLVTAISMTTTTAAVAGPALIGLASIEPAPAAHAAPMAATTAHTTGIGPAPSGGAAQHTPHKATPPAGRITLTIDGHRWEHTVAEGDTLWDIAGRWLDEPTRWPEIYSLNRGRYWPDVTGTTSLRDPDLIHPGWVLDLPADATPPPQATTATPTGAPAGDTDPADATTPELAHEVAPGDWMWHIADRYLGDPHRYPDIAALNPHLDARYDDYPDHIQPGDQLLLPADAHDRGEQRHATGQATTIDEAPPAPPAERPEPTPPADPGPDTPSPPADTTPAPADTTSPAPDTPPTPVPGQVPPPGDDGVVTPPAISAPPGHTPDSPAAADDPPAPDAPDSNESPEGVDIPGGGWVALPLAAAIAAAAALAIINRRRRWRPGQDTPTKLLPQLVRHIRPPAPGPDEPTPEPASQPAADPTHDDADDELDRLEHAAVTVTPPTVGADPQQPWQLDTLPPHGIALAGAGATAAARGLLTAALAAGGPHRPDQAAEAITTADLLTDLELDDPDLARLSVATSIHHALNLLQIETNRRYHVLDNELDQPAGDLPDPPLLVLLSGGIGTQHLHRLDALVNLGHHVGARTVLLGTWPDRPTWQIATDGHTIGADQPGLRLNTLTPQAAGQILSTLAEAHTEPDPHTAPPGEQPTTPASPQTGPATQPPAPPGADGKSDRLLLRLLGKPGAEAPGQREIKVQRAAAMHIAAYLAVHPHGASKDEILEQVLGDKTMRSASQTFDSAIHQLRRALTHPGTGHSAIARHRNGHYHLDPQVIDVDWWQLQHAADTGHPQQVPALYQGPLAHGIDQDWLASPRQHAHNLALTAHDQLADTADDPDQALSHIEAALQLDPYNEHFCRRAMRIHADRGDHTAVLRMLKRLTDRLATLDAEPTQQTRELAAKLTINQQKPTTVPEPPPPSDPPSAPPLPARTPATPAREPQSLQSQRP